MTAGLTAQSEVYTQPIMVLHTNITGRALHNRPLKQCFFQIVSQIPLLLLGYCNIGANLYPIEQTAEYLNVQAVANVIRLIENLNDESTYEECETAKKAFDELSKQLKQQISDKLVDKLSYKLIISSKKKLYWAFNSSDLAVLTFSAEQAESDKASAALTIKHTILFTSKRPFGK